MNEFATILDDLSGSQSNLLKHIMKYSSFPLSERKKELEENISFLIDNNKKKVEEREQKLIGDKEFDEHSKSFNYRLYEYEHKVKTVDYDLTKGSLFIKRIRRCIHFINQVYQNPENRKNIIEQTNFEMRNMIIFEIKEVLKAKISEVYAELKRNNALYVCGTFTEGVCFIQVEINEKNHELAKLEGDLQFFSDEKNTNRVLSEFDISTMDIELLKSNNVRTIYDYLELELELKNRKAR